MAAKDIFHQQVQRALEKDGWTVTDDPLSLKWLGTTLQIDLGAERLIAAQKDAQLIAVEIKSFLSRSRIDDLENALGQLVWYRYLLREQEPPTGVVPGGSRRCLCHVSEPAACRQIAGSGNHSAHYF